MPNTREKIVTYLKFAVFLWTTLFGFFSTYAVAWVAMGLPTNHWGASVAVITLSVMSVRGLIKWMMN